jgi:hypothetical protein
VHTLSTQPCVPSHEDESEAPAVHRSWLHVPVVGVAQHVPLSQVPLHTEPHAPQLASSVWVFVHALLQHVPSVVQPPPH